MTMRTANAGKKCRRRGRFSRRWLALAAACVLLRVWVPAQDPGQRTRVKDVASIEGIRDNQLVGYGLVVGLKGTGDSSQTVFPAQTLVSALQRMGVTVPQTGSNSARTCR